MQTSHRWLTAVFEPAIEQRVTGLPEVRLKPTFHAKIYLFHSVDFNI
jgi:hypothetical protein